MQRILLIPVEKPEHPYADVRLVPIIPILKEKGNIIGLKFIHTVSFETIRNMSLSKIRGYLSLGWYLIKAFLFGLLNIKKTSLIFCEHIYCAAIGFFLSIISDKPCIWDSHGNLTAACEEMGDPKLYAKILRLLERLVIKHVNVLVVPTDLDKELYIKQGLNGEKIKVIPCGVDLSIIDQIKQSKNDLRKELGMDQEMPVLIFTGKRTYLPNKEAAWWINDILAPAIEEGYGRVKIIITGSGEIPQAIHQSVTFAGFVPDIFKYIIAADICLVPVHLDNGISTKLLDFMACSRPSVVLSTVAKGMPEIQDNLNVFLAKDLNHFLERTIEVLFIEKEQLEFIGLNARKIIEDRYSYDIVRREWNKLISKLIIDQ